MKLFEGKTTTERNKIIAAAALGVISLVALFLAFGPSFSSKAPTITVKVSPTPRNSTTSGSTTGDRVLPTADEQRFVYETTPVEYRPGNAYAPDAGRNIFAFYEPPEPCKKDCPTPVPPPIKTPTPATPAPTPPILLLSAIPQNVYAGMPTFKMMVDGNFFTPDSRIYFNQAELPTTFVSERKLSADVTANMIAQEGQMFIEVRTPDGRLYSNQAFLMVNPPPKPTMQYIGMIARKRGNNDTAYFIGGSPTPFGARLNDVVGGQFRLIDISAAEVIFEDVNLLFKHRVPITKSAVASGGVPGGFPGSGFPAGGSIPGIPDNIPRYIPPQNQVRPPQKPTDKKDDVDDKDDPPYRQ